MAIDGSSKSNLSVEGFLQKLLAKKQPFHSLYTSPYTVPPWAADCTHLLYSSKSVPPAFSEPGTLYLCYESTSPDCISLVGQTKDKKRIDRTLNIEARGAGPVKVSSKHMVMGSGRHTEKKFLIYEGKGPTLEAAINNYFEHSDLKTLGYEFSMHNVKKEGDAFLLQKTVSEKGTRYFSNQIIDSLKKIFALVPEEKHVAIFGAIDINLKELCKYLHLDKTKKIANHYDVRLWVIVETVCKHFDYQDLDLRRKAHRDHVIADCCTRLMKGKDIIPQLEHYIQALIKHREILDLANHPAVPEDKKLVIKLHLAQNLIPEISADREKIHAFHQEHIADKSEKPSFRP